MCCFSRPVRFVGSTKIFARAQEPGRQLLAYAMEVDLAEPTAMVLPLPVPPKSPEDAVRFLSLEAYASFFEDLEGAFPADYSRMPQAKSSRSVTFSPPKLEVHRVGRFEASFVPTVADFARLDERFRLPASFFRALPQYSDWGFAVFQLAPEKAGLFGLGTKKQHVHPMAFSFPQREPEALFFPLVHLHDGTVPTKANFDHTLYAQADGVLDALLGWTRSTGPLAASVRAQDTAGLVEGSRTALRDTLWGPRANRDLVLRAPAGVRLGDLRGAGPYHRFEARGRQGFAEPEENADARVKAWHHTAKEKLPAVCRALAKELPALLEARKSAWSLAPLREELAPHFLNGYQLWSGRTYMDGKPSTTQGPGLVALELFTQKVEQQSVTLGFARVPTQDAMDAMRRELEALLDRAVG